MNSQYIRLATVATPNRKYQNQRNRKTFSLNMLIISTHCTVCLWTFPYTNIINTRRDITSWINSSYGFIKKKMKRMGVSSRKETVNYFRDQHQLINLLKLSLQSHTLSLWESCRTPSILCRALSHLTHANQTDSFCCPKNYWAKTLAQ